MSIIKLREAISEGSVVGVLAAFRELTGESLSWGEADEVPAVAKKRGRPKKSNNPAKNRPKAAKVAREKIAPKKNSAKKTVATNGFVDTLEDAREFLQGKKKPKPRYDSDRPAFEKVEVRCDMCGKQESVSPILADRSVGGDYTYYCNKCIGKR